jgi:polyisoprenyl-teichoic acid--peptidoglycan teichoic acid transferase
LPDAPKPPSFWKRIVAGALLIVFASAAGSAALAFSELDKLVNALGQGPKLDLGESLAQAESGEPQTIMLLGSDERADTPKTEPGEFGDPRSDTVILVRLDPAKGATALMSLPRDLKVEIPGEGTGKLNDAYSYGGPKLVVDTVKRLTGLRINHVINVDFGGFTKIVNRLGCVYTDVDRSYQSSGIEYAYINLYAGYQKLCGDDALAYVRFRHEDNDLIRGARQQEFLRQAKEQYTAGELFADRDRLLEIFGEYTESDIDSRSDTLGLLKLALASLDEPVREVHFEGKLGETFVTASDDQVQRLTEDFLGVRDTEGPRSGDENGDSGSGGSGDDGGDGGESPELSDASTTGRAQAEQVAAQESDLPLPVFYPTEMTAGTTFPEEPSVYGIDTPGGGKHAPSYRIVMHSGLLGEYYGLQGTTWKDAPILSSPTTTRTIDGVDYDLHYDGDRLRMVAWETKDGAYWVSNTLLQSLSEEEMLGIATSTEEL